LVRSPSWTEGFLCNLRISCIATRVSPFLLCLPFTAALRISDEMKVDLLQPRMPASTSLLMRRVIFARRSRAPARATKRYASIQHLQPPRGVQYRTLFALLATVPLVATGYGLYLFYSSYSTWPVAVRQPLRSAIQASGLGDSKNAEAFFRKALAEAEALPPTALGPDHRLKVSGIAIALAGLLEEQGRLAEAVECLEEALSDLPTPEAASPAEKQREIALSQKIGSLAQAVGGPAMLAKAETRLSWSVAQLLKAASSDDQRKAAAERTEKGEAGLSANELQLPSWAARTDLGASMENLGAFYLSQGKGECAFIRRCRPT
jgi:tetratricopeptide (TPR) repeat protein